MPDAITIILPVYNGGERLEPSIRAWLQFIRKELPQDSKLVVVDDGSTDGAFEQLASLSEPALQILTHREFQGYGACLRTALEVVMTPIVAYSGLDYPYEPNELNLLLKRLGQSVEIYDRKMIIEAVSGCRTGRPVPGAWKILGRLYRLFCRVAIGVPIDPLPSWFGLHAYVRSWVQWLLLGVPLHDVQSQFKVFRREIFNRFPIQSNGDFVHVEIFAKLTFLSVLIDEIPLPPKTAAIPHASWKDFWTVFTNAKFHSPLPDLTQPATSNV